MLMNDPFYYQSVRKIVSAFGAVFNDISIQRKDSSGNVIQTIEVPISYVPKSRFYYMMEAATLDSNDARINTTLPRIGYEMTSLFYDGSRKLQMQATVPGKLTGTGKRQMEYAPVPYNVSFAMYVATKNTQDALQIVEQIIPFFQPAFNVTIWEMDSAAQSRDVPIIFQNLDFNDTWDGQTNSERTIIWTLTFVASIWVHGPSKEAVEIKQANVNMAVTGNVGSSVVSTTTATVVPSTSTSSDDYMIKVTRTETSDNSN